MLKIKFLTANQFRN